VASGNGEQRRSDGVTEMPEIGFVFSFSNVSAGFADKRTVQEIPVQRAPHEWKRSMHNGFIWAALFIFSWVFWNFFNAIGKAWDMAIYQAFFLPKLMTRHKKDKHQ
jgi:hypothetical protein